MHGLLRNLTATNPRIYHADPEYPFEAYLYKNPTGLNWKIAL